MGGPRGDKGGADEGGAGKAGSRTPSKKAGRPNSSGSTGGAERHGQRDENKQLGGNRGRQGGEKSTDGEQKKDKMKMKPFPDPKTSQAKKGGGKKSSIKQQIRGIERLLKREGVAPEAKAAHETRLKELQDSLQDRQKRDLEQKYSKKYHMVRFFERKKVSRKLAQVVKQLEDKGLGAKERKALEKTRDKLDADLDYIVNFPRDHKYVSLLKTEDKNVVEKMRALVAERKEQERAVLASTRRSEGGLLASSDEEDAANAAPDEEDDFFAAASEDEEASAPSIYPKGGPDVDEAPAGKRKRDKKLPDRNRKKKKSKPEA